MEFSFEVNPDLDLAIGTELSYDEFEGQEEFEEVDLLDGKATTPTEAKPGSEDKVRMLAARYAAGVPLWHDEDCYDHGPSEALPAFEGDNGHHFDLEEEF